VILVFFRAGRFVRELVSAAGVILVVPMCLSSALVGVAMAKMDVKYFREIGFVVLVGLACKNGDSDR